MLMRALLCMLFFVALGATARTMPGNTIYLPDDGRAPSPALEAHRGRLAVQRSVLERYRQRLIRAKAISPRAVLPRVDTFLVTPGGRAMALPATRQVTGLSYTFAEGWTDTEKLALTTFLDAAMSKMVSVYGPPATAGPITLVKGLGTEVSGGEFNVTAMTLTVEAPPDDLATDDSTHYGLNLIHLMLHAFRAPALLGFDAWEEGMARAAADVVMLQMRPDFPLIYSLSYLLPLYDSLNQPALANSTFFPAQGIPQLQMWRIGMAEAAWLKVYAEHPSFFRDFNQAYYAAGGAAGNLTALKSLAAGAATMVEGFSFADWYARQHVLQPVATVGRHLYVYPVPLLDNVSLQIYSYFTNAEGSETAVAGTAALEYWSFDNLPLYPEEGSEVAISATGDFTGVGFINPSFYNIGDIPTQRIKIIVSLDGLRNVVYYPYYARGTDEDENEVFGAVVGADSGSLRIYLPGVPLNATPVVQGAFSQQLPNGDITFFAPVKFVYTGSDNKEVTLWRNVGPGFYAPVLVVGSETAATLRRTFTPGLALVSFPITPNQADPGVLFGYSAGSPDFRMAWWDPSLADASKYRLYPSVPPIAPGRAYWIDLLTSKTVDLVGNLPASDDPRILTLLPGWNMIGNTYTAPLNPWTMRIESGSAAFSVRDAMLKNIIGPVWTYSGGNYVVRNTLDAWEGGWIYNNTGGQLVLRQTTGRAATRAADVEMTRLLTEGGWGIALQARTTTSRDSAAVLGVAPGAQPGIDGLDWQKPPAIGRTVRLAFVHPSRATVGAQYASDIRGSVGALGETWEVEITSRETGSVSLLWPNLKAVPPQYQMILEDAVSGARQYMRTTPAYSYLSRGTVEAPEARRFRIIVETRRDVPLQITRFQVTPTRSRGASIQVATTSAAYLTLQIRSPLGKLIRTITVPASRANDPIVVGWDGRGTGGKLVPTGTYLIMLTARTAEGFVTRRSLPLVVRE
ncbi:MAG: hypothetical protein BWY76_01273 [bacterium ADurb.Bin429]|nr:MAG: hypothetical protein BWY76_01273 [bacterium ADurb.Bin429]